MAPNDVCREIGGYDSKTGEAFPDPNSPAFVSVGGNLIFLELGVTPNEEGEEGAESVVWMKSSDAPENYKLPLHVVTVGVCSEVALLTAIE